MDLTVYVLHRCFLKKNVFRLDLREERLGASRRGLGREFQVPGPMHEKARFNFCTCWVWCVQQSWDLRLRNAESRKADRQKEDHASIGRGRWISTTIAQGGNLVLNPSSDWQPVEGSDRRHCMDSPSPAMEKTSCSVLYSLLRDKHTGHVEILIMSSKRHGALLENPFGEYLMPNGLWLHGSRGYINAVSIIVSF